VNGDKMEEQSSGQGMAETISAKDVLNTAQEESTIESTEESILEAAEGEELEASAEEAEQDSETVKKSEDDLFSAKFAALSRKEKALKKREREIESRLSELEQRLESNKEPEIKQDPLDVRLKKNPLETLQELGIGYETLTQIALNDGKLTPELQMELLKSEMSSGLQSQIEELKTQLSEKEEKEAQQRHEQTISGFRKQIKEHISSNGENLELLAVEGDEGANLVYDVIAEHYNEYEEVLDVNTAAELVENHLLEEAKKRINLSKIRKLMGPSMETKTQDSKPLDKKSSVTLSNDQSQTSSTGRRELSDEEALREAAKHIKWVE
jgi:hypothetical protein